MVEFLRNDGCVILQYVVLVLEGEYFFGGQKTFDSLLTKKQVDIP